MIKTLNLKANIHSLIKFLQHLKMEKKYQEIIEKYKKDLENERRVIKKQKLDIDDYKNQIVIFKNLLNLL